MTIGNVSNVTLGYWCISNSTFMVNLEKVIEMVHLMQKEVTVRVLLRKIFFN